MIYLAHCIWSHRALLTPILLAALAGCQNQRSPGSSPRGDFIELTSNVMQGPTIRILLLGEGAAKIELSEAPTSAAIPQKRIILLPAHPKEVRNLAAVTSTLIDQSLLMSPLPPTARFPSEGTLTLRCRKDGRTRTLATSMPADRTHEWMLNALTEQIEIAGHLRLAQSIDAFQKATACIKAGELEDGSANLKAAIDTLELWDGSFRHRYLPPTLDSKNVLRLDVDTPGGPLTVTGAVAPLDLVRLGIPREKANEISSRSWVNELNSEAQLAGVDGATIVSFRNELVAAGGTGLPDTIPTSLAKMLLADPQLTPPTQGK